MPEGTRHAFGNHRAVKKVRKVGDGVVSQYAYCYPSVFYSSSNNEIHFGRDTKCFKKICIEILNF